MAGEWLKFDASLPEKPETLAVTIAMGWEDPDLTVGKLMRLFRWFDQHTIAGNAPRVTAALLDRIIGVTGFVQAVASTGWIVISDDGVTLQNFDRHNGATAKSRAQTAKRVATYRASDESNAPSNAATVTPALAREEKRREEKEPPKPPKGAAFEPEGFRSFWEAWPTSTRKGGKDKCLAVWRDKRHEGAAEVIVAHVVAMAATKDWTKEGGQYVPAPVVYLRSTAWTGAEVDAPHAQYAGAI